MNPPRESNKPDFAIRGVMLDSARLVERPRVYRELIPMFAAWGYNCLLWHFIDDQGCSLVFPRRPEIASNHAMTQRQTRVLVELADKHGLMVVPEVECFGHTGRIVSLPRYRHLRDGARGKQFGAICPFHPDARALLKDLLTDTADTFKSPYIHVGLDEVGFGEHPFSKKLLKKAKKWELFAEHINWLHEIVRGLGRSMMMWGDHLYKAPMTETPLFDADAFSERIIDRIPKDIVVCDWHYLPDVPTAQLDYLTAKGFEVLCCPAVSAWGMTNHPALWNLDNLRNFAAKAAERRTQGVVGMISTVWTPVRWFPGAILAATALGAACQQAGGREPKNFLSKFVSSTFGTVGRATKDVAEAIRIMHRVSPSRTLFFKATPAGPDDLSETTAHDLRELGRCERGAAKANRLFRRTRSAILKNRHYFDDLIFASGCLRQVAGLPKRLLRLDSLVLAGAFASAWKALASELASATALHRDSSERWAIWRYGDDPTRDGSNETAKFADSVSQRLKATSEYLASLYGRNGAALSRDWAGCKAISQLRGRL